MKSLIKRLDRFMRGETSFAQDVAAVFVAFALTAAVLAVPFCALAQEPVQLPPEIAQVGQDVKSVHDAYQQLGIPGLAAAAFVVALRLLRKPRVQAFLASKDPRLVWDAWPFWAKFGIAVLGSGASGALAAAALPGAALSWSLLGTSLVSSMIAIFLNEGTKAGGEAMAPALDRLPGPAKAVTDLILPTPRRSGLAEPVPISVEAMHAKQREHLERQE